MRLAAAAALATTLGAAGCSGRGPGPGADQAGADQAGAASGPATAQQKLADWIRAVIAGDYDRACTEQARTDVSPPVPYTAAQCRGDGLDRALMDNLRAEIGPVRSTGQVDIQIDGPPVTSGSTTITNDRITIDGQRFDHVYTPQSPGGYVEPAGLSVTFGLTRIGDTWYLVPASSLG